MESAAIAAFMQQVAHLRKLRLRLVTERKQGLGATESFALPRDLEYLFGRHGMSAGLSGVAAVGAVAAVIATEVGQGQKNLTRVGNDSRAILLLEEAGGREQFRKHFRTALQQPERRAARDEFAVANFTQIRSEIDRRNEIGRAHV